MRGLMAVSGWATWFVVAALVAGGLWTLTDWLSGADYTSWLPAPVTFAAGIVAMGLMAGVLEVFFPLKSYGSTDWVWRIRPRGTGSSITGLSVLQVVVFGAVGWIVGAATGFPVAGALAGLAIRGLGLARRSTVPSLLRSGRLTSAHSSLWTVPDSELVSEVFASTWPAWRAWRPTAEPAVLFFRRLYRRSYLVAIAFSVFVAGLVLVGTLGEYVHVGFIVAWALLGASITRLADFSRFPTCHAPRWYAIAGHCAVGFVALWALGATSGWTGLAAIVSWVSAALGRSRPRRVTTISVVESGIAGTFSPELVEYHLRGLTVTLVAAAALVINLSIA